MEQGGGRRRGVQKKWGKMWELEGAGCWSADHCAKSKEQPAAPAAGSWARNQSRAQPAGGRSSQARGHRAHAPSVDQQPPGHHPADCRTLFEARSLPQPLVRSRQRAAPARGWPAAAARAAGCAAGACRQRRCRRRRPGTEGEVDWQAEAGEEVEEGVGGVADSHRGRLACGAGLWAWQQGGWASHSRGPQAGGTLAQPPLSSVQAVGQQRRAGAMLDRATACRTCHQRCRREVHGGGGEQPQRQRCQLEAPCQCCQALLGQGVAQQLHAQGARGGRWQQIGRSAGRRSPGRSGWSSTRAWQAGLRSTKLGRSASSRNRSMPAAGPRQRTGVAQ